MENENQDRLGSWDNYVSGNFLKAANVENEGDAFVVKEVSEFERDGVPSIRISLERNGNDWDFDVNKTNAKKLQEFVKTPKELVSKKLYFRKALVRNPKTNQEVESLRVTKVE